jgi:hypothetical protein
MLWWNQSLSHVSLATTRVLIYNYYNEFSRVATHVRWLVKLKQKAPEMTCTSDASALQEVASDANTSSSLLIGWIGTEVLTLTSNVCIPVG